MNKRLTKNPGNFFIKLSNLNLHTQSSFISAQYLQKYKYIIDDYYDYS